ncbi:hypothetical protein KHO57_gp134 [Mycobacterium phage Phabba]|uniref:Uncharacterized protein n=1 Tax=Mycobacterium phage Phabba TaxID=2027899 RepID=A0A249XSY9_9CAUD|nr:hypothetical protein KHO57_gp134 [Mycobacterium phage Phabba]ASZ74770.1 hypothetical protein SEA_PHABBA_233 [Mycobacterium phage Phabba]
MKKFIKALVGIPVAGLLIFGLTACDEDATLAVPQSFCGFLMGKGGRDNSDRANNAELGRVLYQGQSADFKKDQQVGKLFPCVTRNYVIAPQGQSADTNNPLRAMTEGVDGKPGTPVYVWVSVYWQPNQQPDPIRDFIGFAQGKYGAAADSPQAFTGEGAQNASTPGWNKMLAENMYPTLQRIVEQPLRSIGDLVWQVNDPALRQSISDEMSDRFAEVFQQTTGSVNDLICGSGSTGTGDQFNCEPVRIVVDLVTAQDQNTQTAAAQNAAQASQNKLAQDTKAADIALTNELYGPLAPQFRACRDLNKVAAGSCKLFPGADVQVQAPGQ